MRSKQAFATLIAIMVIMANVFAVYAVSADAGGLGEPVITEMVQDDLLQPETEETLEESQVSGEQPFFTGEIVTEGEQPGLYITLKNAPEDLSLVIMEYSFGGSSFFQEAGRIWEEEDFYIDDEGNLTLFCYELGEQPLSAFLSESVNSLYIRVLYSTYSGMDNIVELESIRFSHDKTYEIPQTPPPFSMEFKLGWFSYTVIGHFEDFPPNVDKICNMYSWDGVDYMYTNPEWPIMWDLRDLGNEDPKARKGLENQEVGQDHLEFMESFYKGEHDDFYMRLEITTEDGQVYYSQPAYLSRGETKPLPENLTPRVALGFNLSVMEILGDGDLEDDEEYNPEVYTHGEFQLTVPEDITPEELTSLLPETVPVRVRLWDKYTKEKYAIGDLNCQVIWKDIPSLSLTPGEPFVMEDMAESLVIPSGTDVVSTIGTFTLQKQLTFKSRYDSDDIHLILNPVASGADPEVVLQGYNLNLVEDGEDMNESRADEPMSLAFWNKPSGATAIKAYWSAEGNRGEICDLLERRDINHNQSHELYGYVDLLRPDEYPLKEYLSGEIDSFSIELEIEGGVYDGKRVTLPWPMKYQGPKEVFDPYGFDGQENNAGSGGFEEIDEDDESGGGQWPWLPPGKEQANGSKPKLPAVEEDGEQVLNPEVPNSMGSQDTEMVPSEDIEVPLSNQVAATTPHGNGQTTDSTPAGSNNQDNIEEQPNLQPAPVTGEHLEGREQREAVKSGTLPTALKITLIATGTGTLLLIGGTATGAGQMSIVGKLFAALKKLLHK